MRMSLYHCLFFFNDTATTEIYTLSLHDALPISLQEAGATVELTDVVEEAKARGLKFPLLDRKSTRLNSSHSQISYAVFCLKKKKITLSAYPYISTSSLSSSNLRRPPMSCRRLVS